MFEKEAEEYRKDVKSKFFLSEPQLDLACQGFKDGYNKANEWHILEKNPNDLPKDKRYVWCDYGEGYGKGCYSKDDGGWWIEGHMFYSDIDAWCELPTRNKGDK